MTQRTELFVVCRNVPELDALIADLGPNGQVRVVEAHEDPLIALDRAMRDTNFDALHLIAHGAAGRVVMGKGSLDATTLLERHAITGTWADALGGKDILIHACETGAGPEGQRLVQTLCDMTGAAVAAASAPIGRTATGQNWALDVASAGRAVTTPLPFSKAFQAEYRGTLANVTFSMNHNWVTETPAPGETEPTVDFIFTLDQPLGTGETVKVWLYATAEENGALQDALRGDQASNQFDVFKTFDPAYYDGIEFPFRDVSVEAGLSAFTDQYVFEITITAQEGRLTLVGYDDTDFDGGDGQADNPRSYFWNVIDAPNGDAVHTITDGSQPFTEYHSIDDVPPENSAPVAVADSLSTDFETTKNINVMANDSDADGDTLSIQSFTQGSNGSVTQNANQRLVYTPDAGFSGQDSFSYTISDGNGGTDTATVTVTVGEPPNTDPVAVNDTATTAFGSAVAIHVMANDSDPDGDSLSIFSFGQPSNGTVTQNANQRLVYTPDAGFSGQDSFTYRISDGNGGLDLAQVVVTVEEPANTAPEANKDIVSTAYETAKAIHVMANDTDADGDSLSIVTFGQATNGTVTINANQRLVYTPDAGFSGKDKFSYTISDGNGGTDFGQVRVTVEAPPNTEPDAIKDVVTTGFETLKAINVLANDTDADGDSLSIVSFSQPANGTVYENANHKLVYTPNAGFSGKDKFSYTVSDGNGGKDVAQVQITVDGPPNADPVANKDVVTTAFETALSVNVLANDTDSDGDTLSVISFGQATDGTVTQSGNQLVYTPDAGFSGADKFSYTISDGNGGKDFGQVRITVDAAASSASAPAPQNAFVEVDTIVFGSGTAGADDEAVIVVAENSGPVTDPFEDNVDDLLVNPADLSLTAPAFDFT